MIINNLSIIRNHSHRVYKENNSFIIAKIGSLECLTNKNFVNNLKYITAKVY